MEYQARQELELGMNLKPTEFLKGNRAFADLRYGKEDSISHVALNFAATKGLLGKYTLHLCAEVLF